VELRLDYAKATLENLFKIWTRPVHIETVVGEDHTLFSFDGSSHSDQKITEKNTA
jgi:stage V sporulation protein R